VIPALSSPVVEGFEFSPQQKRAWSLYAANPGLTLGAQCTVRLAGVHQATLEEAIVRIRQRYEILRTRFALLEGASFPVQVIDDCGGGLDDLIDFTNIKGEELQLKRRMIAASEWDAHARPNEMAGIRFVMIRLARQHFALIITASALCCDAVGLLRVVEELQLDRLESSQEPPEGLQYADLSEWQNQLIAQAEAAQQQPYWKSPDFAVLFSPSVPFERRCPEIATLARISRTLRAVEGEIFRELKNAVRQQGTTMHSLLCAAWQVLLRSYCRKDQFVIGVTLEGRLEAELDRAVGSFAKILPLAADLEPTVPFQRVLQNVDAALKVAQYDQLLYNWESLETSQLISIPSFLPIQFSGNDLSELESDESHVWQIESLRECQEPFALRLAATIYQDQLELEFAWDENRFAQSDIEGVAVAFENLLRHLRTGFHVEIGKVSYGLNTAAPTYDGGGTQEFRPLHGWFEEQASRTPGKVALAGADGQLTYGDLNSKASQLARQLLELGAGQEKLVAIVAGRKAEFFVGILAIMKTGAAWLPIEANTPLERIRLLLDRSRSVAVLAGKDAPLQLESACRILPLSGNAESADDAFPAPVVHPNQLAYVIFTSGSTGLPKGVCIEHAQVSSYIQALHSAIDMSTCRQFAMVSTVGADLGLTAVFAALTSGGCLHIIPSECATDAEALAHYFLEHSVDFIKIVPSHLESLCRCFPVGTVLPWKVVVLGGDRLHWDLVERVRHLAPGCRVYNHYGPTETTVGVQCGLADPDSESYNGRDVPIGQTLRGATSYLLDGNLQEVPAWIPGELYIGGHSVARGYLGRGDLTADRFVPDPFHGAYGARMYRTGDYARRRGDGTLEFLGRIDGQVKIRGYRVELGEIEAALRKYPGVHNAAAAVVERPAQGKQLVVWLAVGNAKLDTAAVRGFLSRLLPEYMLPSSIVCVERLTLNANGKVDRKLLPMVAESPHAKKSQAPSNDVEVDLIAVWRQVLGVERVSIDDNYFSLGGDSLRVIQLVHEARKYGIRITAADVLRHQTIRQLRRAVREKARTELFPGGLPPLPLPSDEIIALLPADVVNCYPIAGMQRFVIDEYRKNVGSRGFFHIQDVLQLHDQTFSAEALRHASRAVVERHPALRTVFDTQNSLQWVRSSLQWDLQIEDISSLSTEEQDASLIAAMRSDRGNLFDVEDQNKPLFRMKVLQRSAADFDFLCSFHHAILDGWGHRVMTHQLLQAYQAIKNGETPDLGSADATYGEFVTLQHAVATLPTAREFWSEYLSGVEFSTLRNQPVKETEPEPPAFLRELDAEFVRRIMQMARKQAVSVQALMLAGWLNVIRESSQSEHVVAGLIANGRSEYLSDPLSAVGLFWNVVPVVSRRSMGLMEQAAQVQRDLVSMDPFLTYPLPQIIQDQGHRDLFDSVFRYLNFWNSESIDGESGLKLRGTKAYDRYSFPLDCIAFFNADGKGACLIVQYDARVVSSTLAETLLENYCVLLKRLVDAEQQAA